MLRCLTKRRGYHLRGELESTEVRVPSISGDKGNFNDKTSLGQTIPFHSEDLHTTERFTRVSPNLIDYQLTLEDQKLFTRPIKLAGYFAAAPKGTEPMEFACAEGSLTLPNIFGIEFAPSR
jgi:hypothetical protein